MNDYSLVLGVDAAHLEQLETVLPTWRKHKPSLFDREIIVFYDYKQLTNRDVSRIIPHAEPIPWPPQGVDYGEGQTKWDNPQRYKMLAGFVHVPSSYVHNPYWLKLDTDTVATGMDDWVDPAWFQGNPVIVSQRWSYTKPANQMLLLDQWAKHFDWPRDPLRLTPQPGSGMLSHRRIISWCAFFRTSITAWASHVAWKSCGPGQLPVPSQDGFMWYVAQRIGGEVVRVQMKSRGWKHRSNLRNIQEAVKESLA